MDLRVSSTDIIEWADFKDDSLFYKWPGNAIRKDSNFVIRPDQILIIFADGQIEGVFKNQGQYGFFTQIVPKLLSRNNFYEYNPDSDMPAEVYFINVKELFVTWETKPKALIITPETPSGIPIGIKGSFQVKYRDYNNFINRIAGLRDSYTLADIAERIQKEVNPIIVNSILDGRKTADINKLIKLRTDNADLAKRLSGELNRKFNMQGLEIVDFVITSYDYPGEINKLADKAVVNSVTVETVKKQESLR